MPLSLQQAWRDIFFTSRDGLRLYGRHYPAGTQPAGHGLTRPAQVSPSGRRPLLCLAGLTRNSRDFHALARLLSGDAREARDVYTIDYRGRGLSAHDPDWRNYTLQTELFDVLDFMTLTGLHDAAVLGSSRGGLISMIIGLYRPASIGLAILNDIGPVVEREGLLRMIAYVGRVPLPMTWDEATELTKGMGARHFPAIPDTAWPTIARQSYLDVGGRPGHAYDPKLGRSVSLLDGPIPPLWHEFQSLARVPTLVIRGERSDILTERTVDDMRVRHPGLEAIVVPGQGHAPMLMDAPTMGAIAQFLVNNDQPATRPTRRMLRAAE